MINNLYYVEWEAEGGIHRAVIQTKDIADAIESVVNEIESATFANIVVAGIVPTGQVKVIDATIH